MDIITDAGYTLQFLNTFNHLDILICFDEEISLQSTREGEARDSRQCPGGVEQD